MRFEQFFLRTSIAMALINRRGEITRINPAFLHLLDCPETQVVGYSLTDLLSNWEQIDEQSGSCEPENLNVLIRHRTDLKRVLRVTNLPTSIYHEGELCGLVTLQDVAADSHTLARMNYLCNYDPLTGVANISLLMERLQHGIDVAGRLGKKMVLVLLNIRRFKNLNSTFGHDAGDEILHETAQRILATVRRGDTVARHYGDKFAVLFENIPSTAAVELVLDKLFRAMDRPFHLDKSEIYLSIGAGIAIYPEDGLEPGILLGNAESAMRQSAGTGTSTYRYFTAEMQHQARTRVQRENALHHALERGEYEIFYQPILEPGTLRVLAVEALLRWNHPSEGCLSPREFIPLLEETGLIIKVGDWVLRTACRQLRYWRENGYPALRLAVNISSRQFQTRAFASRLKKILEVAQLSPTALELEITESVLMEDNEESRQALAAVSAMGVHLSIDDFGTGYSSLIYLKRLPVNTVKIDRGFIQGLPHGHHDISIARAIITLARNLGMNVTAEGVETRAQLDFLGECDCQGLQGFYFAPPMEAKAFSLWHHPGGAG